MIDLKNKLIFIHLERTGGTSIECIFTGRDWWGKKTPYLININYDNGLEKHVTYELATTIYKNYINNYKIFTIIRHPIDLFKSKLRWRGYRNIITVVDINKLIVENELRWGIKKLHEIVGKPNNYDFIIRFETFKTDFEIMLEMFGLDKDKFILLHKNKTDRKKNNIVLTAGALAAIKQYSLTYCKLFKYDFN